MDIQFTMEQKQALSQRMVQSAQILQMSAQELEEYLENLALENPVIDLEEHSQPPGLEAGRLQKYEWLNSLDDQNSASFYTQERPGDDGPEDPWNFAAKDGETLKEYLWSQLISTGLAQEYGEVLEYLLDSLDSKGYLTESPEEVALEFHIGPETAESLILSLQALEPAGICARNLEECLKLQLERTGDLNQVAAAIIDRHLDQVAKNHLPQIAKALHVPISQVSRCCQLIRGLNPKPGSCFCSREQLHYIIPDITLVKFEGRYEILLNEYLYPEIRINSYYRQISKGQEDPETTAYLEQKIRQAEWVRDCISQRNATLLAVAKSILGFQEEFFSQGISRLKPLGLRHVANDLGVHESTVSRAARGKYLQCIWGVYPMNFFFSKGLCAGQGQVSVGKMKQMIAQVVEEEDGKKPFSDRAIAEELGKKGVTISRRTVAKYRQQLNIPDASGRKPCP